MSMSRRCDYVKANNGKWYVLLGNFEYANDQEDCTWYGPFIDEDACDDYVSRAHSNPGGVSFNDHGSMPPPKKVTSPNPARGMYRRPFQRY